MRFSSPAPLLDSVVASAGKAAPPSPLLARRRLEALAAAARAELASRGSDEEVEAALSRLDTAMRALDS